MENKEHYVNELSLSSLGREMQSNELNSGAQQLPDYFVNLNWENSVDQNDPFESALSSIVSFRTPQNAGPIPAGSNGLEIQELIGKLGNICESGDISGPISCVGSNSNSADPSCYNTPISSPTKLSFLANSGRHLPMHPSWAPFPADPGFAERAARFSCFSGGNSSGQNGNLGSSGTEFQYGSVPGMGSHEVSGMCNEQSLTGGTGSMTLHDVKTASGSSRFVHLRKSTTFENAEFGNSREGSSVSEQISRECQSMKVRNDVNGRKRKPNPRGKAKETKVDGKVESHNVESNAKRVKQDEASGRQKDVNAQNTESSGDVNPKQENDASKQPEPPKDYIHVRARRGQATDAHSLAERVRRERISERMKFLQDLVPGCNKVTGKAVMLDEIINYVQSLQRQVEFLSMKLATINPSMDFNIEALLSKDVFQSIGSFIQTTVPLNCSQTSFPNEYQSQHMSSLQSGISTKVDQQVLMSHVNAAFCTNSSIPLTTTSNFAESASQVPSLWEDDLQSVVQMGSSQYQTPSCHRLIAADYMNIDL